MPRTLHSEGNDIDRPDFCRDVGHLDPSQRHLAERAFDPNAVASQRFEMTAAGD
jgi:hypothetical protein